MTLISGGMYVSVCLLLICIRFGVDDVETSDESMSTPSRLDHALVTHWPTTEPRGRSYICDTGGRHLVEACMMGAVCKWCRGSQAVRGEEVEDEQMAVVPFRPPTFATPPPVVVHSPSTKRSFPPRSDVVSKG
ncbi:hypothetical protein OF83DRAFT_186556 [Amylostereum chailletii]|nr:hypothetical protein OF83DRAFT_186556 [Amylostereum chailletii]